MYHDIIPYFENCTRQYIFAYFVVSFDNYSPNGIYLLVHK